MGWKFLEGNNIKLIFDDSKAVNTKTGILKEVNEDYFGVQTALGLEFIAKSRIVWMELIGGQDGNSNRN